MRDWSSAAGGDDESDATPGNRSPFLADCWLMLLCGIGTGIFGTLAGTALAAGKKADRTVVIVFALIALMGLATAINYIYSNLKARLTT